MRDFESMLFALFFAHDIGHVSGAAEFTEVDVNYIEHGIGDWSEYIYEARRTPFEKLIITNTRPVRDQAQASHMINNMINLCRQYTGV
ncbi:hypothetical protein ANO11243_095730 [Dothideomycetidae sp. 11243]|nr:hypothetical protein ANO11243_095730 [fungal sp. No.11243]